MTVKYVVSGRSPKAMIITFVSNASGETSTFLNASLPWSYSFTADRGDTVYVSAVSNDSVKVQIFVDDELRAEDWGDYIAETPCVVE